MAGQHTFTFNVYSENIQTHTHEVNKKYVMIKCTNDPCYSPDQSTR